MITLFGATGYTGRLVARTLARLELPFRLAGRSPEKLTRLSNSLPSTPSWLVADATRPDTLSALFQDTHVLINCVGPFTDLGESVVVQAALSSVHYLDTTNELGYVYRMQDYDALARQNGAAIVLSCGFEVALADCAAAVLSANPLAGRRCAASVEPAGGFQTFDEVSVVYALSGRGTSFATRCSAVRALATSWLGYQEGRWGWAIPGGETRRDQLPDGIRRVLSFPSSETVTIPSHVSVRRVTTWMTFSRPLVLWGPLLVPIFAWLARGPVGAIVMAMASQVAPPPETGMRSQALFSVQVELRRGGAGQTLTLTGKGVYDITAEIIAYAAGRMIQPGYDRSGVLAPAVAFDPQALLDHAIAEWGVTVKCNV
ncbi:MAG: saccharopine dehydrogenase NADP-binding domain-containing protein [Anaerolineae bacterium]